MNGDVLGEASFGTETVVSGSELMREDDAPHLSVLSANVSGNARLHEKLGHTEALRAVDRCLKRMERATEAYGGRIVMMAGDEMMAVFPLADEAFQAAIEMQQKVADLPPVSGLQLTIRVGLSFGSVTESEGNYDGEAVKLAARLAGLSEPGQILICHYAQSLLSPAMQSSTRDLGSAAARGNWLGMKAFEIVVPDPAVSRKKAEREHERNSDRPQCARLRLCYGGEVVVVDDEKPVIIMGRKAECDLYIQDRRASRNHAKIERRGISLVLTDTSTNGTFVTLVGKPELKLRREECVIHGKGVISFAASAASPDADCVEFEQLSP